MLCSFAITHDILKTVLQHHGHQRCQRRRFLLMALRCTYIWWLLNDHTGILKKSSSLPTSSLSSFYLPSKNKWTPHHHHHRRRRRRRRRRRHHRLMSFLLLLLLIIIIIIIIPKTFLHESLANGMTAWDPTFLLSKWTSVEEQWRARTVSTHLDTQARATHHSPQSCSEVAIEAMDENQKPVSMHLCTVQFRQIPYPSMLNPSINR